MSFQHRTKSDINYFFCLAFCILHFVFRNVAVFIGMYLMLPKIPSEIQAPFDDGNKTSNYPNNCVQGNSIKIYDDMVLS